MLSSLGLAAAGFVASLGGVMPGGGGVPAAWAYAPPPPGYRLQVDKIDGYTFLYPDNWLVSEEGGGSRGRKGREERGRSW